MISPSDSAAAKVVEAFAQAESAIKLAERSTAALPESAINQLRYAGQHLCAILGETSESAKNGLLEKAYNHCLRARYDAYEDIVLTSLQSIREFKALEYPVDAIEHYYPGYGAAMLELTEIQQLLIKSAKVQEWSPAELDKNAVAATRVAEIGRHVETAAIHLRKLRVAQEEYEAKLAQHREDQRFVISILVTLYGTFAGVLGTIVTIYFSLHGNYPLAWIVGMLAVTTAGVAIAYLLLKKQFSLRS